MMSEDGSRKNSDSTILEPGDYTWKRNPNALIDLYKFYDEQINKSTSRIWKMIFFSVGCISTTSTAAYQLAIQIFPSSDESSLNSQLIKPFSITLIALPIIALWIICIGYIFMRGEYSRLLRFIILKNKIEMLLHLTESCNTKVFPRDKSFLSSKYYQSVLAENKYNSGKPNKKAYASSSKFIQKEFAYNINIESLAKSRRIIFWGLIYIGLALLCLVQIYDWSILANENIINNIPDEMQLIPSIIIIVSCIAPIILVIWSDIQWRETIRKEG